ncbi:hypothetical protein BD324DRAFT_624532 [Kockovaella imperatae]|uniref:Uncharacterized protein n=1 Tax=Kockovaella imperatae TaxID=4999 RepID=A0A1Y1UHR2_9TREE|nr:hypothetical protein BD324DRAFT_624532 [Kockovaella imperatae]ORX37026.1 hypothetical protein BD324DRAFT_624532 [Kockovaella imperatae]
MIGAELSHWDLGRNPSYPIASFALRGQPKLPPTRRHHGDERCHEQSKMGSAANLAVLPKLVKIRVPDSRSVKEGGKGSAYSSTTGLPRRCVSKDRVIGKGLRSLSYVIGRARIAGSSFLGARSGTYPSMQAMEFWFVCSLGTGGFLLREARS